MTARLSVPAPALGLRDGAAGIDARWPSWALPLAGAAASGCRSWDDLVGHGRRALGYTTVKADNAVCWLENEGLLRETVVAGVCVLTVTGWRFLKEHRALPCGCFVCCSLQKWRAELAR